MDEINVHAVRNTLPKIQSGVDTYRVIQTNLHRCDVSADIEFQRRYKGFYKVQRNDYFCGVYFGYMENHKPYNIRFEDVVTFIYNTTNRIEPSFSSKLLATINPKMPVWDSLVLSQLSLKAPAYYKVNRLSESICLYKAIVSWYENYLETSNANDVIGVFDEIYPNTEITNVKKIDFALWSLGKMSKNVV